MDKTNARKWVAGAEESRCFRVASSIAAERARWCGGMSMASRLNHSGRAAALAIADTAEITWEDIPVEQPSKLSTSDLERRLESMKVAGACSWALRRFTGP